jgi:uncharacterized protein
LLLAAARPKIIAREGRDPSPAKAGAVNFLDAALLFLAAVGGGALNSVAGGGSFLTFPTLLFTGVTPIIANATSTVALWPGSIASASAYRRDLRSSRRHLLSFAIASLVGGFVGARILLRTSDGDFRALVPWLLLLATLVFAFGNQIVSRIWKKRDTEHAPSRASAIAAVATQLVIATYGGFFGGGMGILMLATFTILGMRDIHAMNGMKNTLAVCINGIAVLTFVAAGAVLWPQAMVMLAGAVMGGYGGASLAKRLNPQHVRRFVIALGLVLSGYFFANG